MAYQIYEIYVNTQRPTTGIPTLEKPLDSYEKASNWIKEKCTVRGVNGEEPSFNEVLAQGYYILNTETEYVDKDEAGFLQIFRLEDEQET